MQSNNWNRSRLLFTSYEFDFKWYKFAHTTVRFSLASCVMSSLDYFVFSPRCFATYMYV